MTRISPKEVTAKLPDREPDFEDERIQMWRARRLGSASSDFIDESVLSVDLEKEEVFESRVYPLVPHPATLAFAESRLQSSPAPGDPARLLEELQRVIEQSALKVASKRSRADGQITYLVAAIGSEGGALIEQHQVPDEASYRRAVLELEEDLLVPGLVDEPSITTLDEWRWYEQQSG